MSRPLRILISVLALSLPSMASATDSPVYQCPGPSSTMLYTNIERPNCLPMTLGALTIAPTRTYSTINSPSYTPLEPFPSDWDHQSVPVDSWENRLMPSYPPQRFGGGLALRPQGSGHGLGHHPYNSGKTSDQHLHGSGHASESLLQRSDRSPGQPPQGFGRTPRYSVPNFGAAPRPPSSRSR